VSSRIQDCLEGLPCTRKEAIAKGALHYFTGKPCKHGHFAKRQVSTKACTECEKNRDIRRRATNPERLRKSMRKWKRANPDKVNAEKARRRAVKTNATPPWANQKTIQNFYTEAKKLERLTKIAYHVDHIYPLKSDFLCGLHVENNLQVLTAEENLSKNNRTWPGQLPCQTGRGTDHGWWRELNEIIQSPSTSGGLSL
jgi:hypothetical protein